MMFHKFSLFLLLLALPALCPGAVQVEKVTIGLDGYFRAERWVPVVFQIRNAGERFQGKIRVRKGNTIFEKSLDLGETTQKRVEILYYHSSHYESVSYSIHDNAENKVMEANLDPRALNHRDNLLLVISADEYNHQFLNGQENPWGGKSFVAYYRPQDLFNEWMAYATADGIAIGSLSPEQLLPAQWKAIAQYIASGGALICSAATDLAVLKDPLIRNHLPEIHAELNQVSAGDFLMTYWVRKTTDSFPVFEIPAQSVRARPCDRSLVLLSQEYSLITSSPYYKGSIAYFAFDYSRLPEDLRNIFARFWNSAVYPTTPAGDPVFQHKFRQKLDENPRVQKDLYNIPGLKLPDFKWFALFFFIYICAIGPFQYLILKFLKRSSLLWISFPAIILLFTFASFGYTKYRQSGRGKITNVGIIEIFPSLNQQTMYQVYGAVMSESGTFDFQSSSESSYLRKTAIQSFNYQPEPFVLSEDLPHRLIGESMKRWTFRSFDAFDVQTPSLNFRMKLNVESGEVRGEITNGTNYDIEESFFLYDSRNTVALGTLKAGTTRSFSLALKNDRYPPWAEKHLRDLLHLYSVSYSNPHFFFGEIQDAKGEFFVNGRGRKTEATIYLAVYIDSPDAIVMNPWLPSVSY